MENNKFIVPLAIIVAGAMVAGAIYFGGNKPSARSLTGSGENPNQAQTVKVAKVTSSDHILGDINAPVVVVEYSDTECPFCKVFHSTMQQIVSDYKGQVAWVYREFPIPQLHSKAPKEAEALECAADQGGNQAFWNFLDKVFATTNSNNSLDPAQLPIIASSVGLDVNAFNSCLSSGKYTKEVSDSMNAAIAAGAQGTPYSVIIAKNGKQDTINGAMDYNGVKAKIDALLK